MLTLSNLSKTVVVMISTFVITDIVSKTKIVMSSRYVTKMKFLLKRKFTLNTHAMELHFINEEVDVFAKKAFCDCTTSSEVQHA